MFALNSIPQPPAEPTAPQKRYLIIRRFTEMLLWTVFLSIISIFLNFSGIAGSQKMLMVCLSAGVVVFIGINLHMLKQCFFDLRDKKLYYFTNYIAYLFYAAVSIIIYAIGGNTVYAWIFAITKFMRYSSFGISTPLSALIFHLIMLLVIAVAPLGMNWIFTEDEDDYYV